MLRLACSIQSGVTTASLLIRKIAAQHTNLSIALRELGRIERTLFILDYLEQPTLRLQILMGLNKGEARNALAKAVFFYRQGELLDRTWEQQSNSASGLNLVVAAIILWNTVYLAKAIAYLRQQGEVIPDEYLKHLSPGCLGAYLPHRRVCVEPEAPNGHLIPFVHYGLNEEIPCP